MKVSDVIIKLMESCKGDVNRDLQYFKMEEYGFKNGIPKVVLVYEFEDEFNITHKMEEDSR